MNIENFEYLVKSEKNACRYLRKFCEKKGHVFCVKCGRSDPYRLSSGRYRCRRCQTDFGIFTGRWISSTRLVPKQWLWLLKLFTLEVSTRKIATELGISYPAALNAVDALRACIVAHCSDFEQLKGSVELDESYFGGKRKGKRGRGAAGKVPVFGILERRGKVSVQVVPNVTAETLMEATVRKVRRGSIVYTDKYCGYNSLMFCGYRHLKVNHTKHFVRGKVHINGLEGFWAFAKERLIKHHGVAPRKFLFYIKEQEFRYNNRERDIFSRIYLAHKVTST